MKARREEWKATQNGLEIDRQGLGAVLFTIQAGVLNADTAVTVTLEESDVSGSGFAAVAGFSQAIGGADDGLRFEFMVPGEARKRFLRLVFTGTSTSALLAALATLGDPAFAPTA